MRIVLLGPPGAGKGTQAGQIVKKLKIPSVSSGDLFRDHERRKTSLGLLAQTYMNKGILVPDDITTKMIIGWISQHGNKGDFLLDGFPRTLAQATSLDESLDKKNSIDRAFYIKVSEDVLVKRLSTRLICVSCQTPHTSTRDKIKESNKCVMCNGNLYQREDDKPKAVCARIREYMNKTSPLIEYYANSSILKEVNGENPVPKVTQLIIGSL